MKKLKKIFEVWLIKKLLSNSGLSEKDIDQERRRIDLGLWAMAKHFFEPRHNIIVYILMKWYGYKCYQSEFVIQATWCNMTQETVNERFSEFNKEFQERCKNKLDKTKS